MCASIEVIPNPIILQTHSELIVHFNKSFSWLNGRLRDHLDFP